MADTRRFKGIGSITPVITALPAVHRATAKINPSCVDLFRSSLERVSLVYSAKPALVSAMKTFNGSLRDAAWRSGDKRAMEQAEIVRTIRRRANDMACSGADLHLVETELAAWEKSEALLLTMLDALAGKSQMGLF